MSNGLKQFGVVVVLMVIFPSIFCMYDVECPGQDDFDNQVKLAGDKLVVAEFYADWCKDCKNIAPKVEELDEKYGDEVIILKIDIDRCEELSEDYKITEIPTYFFIRNGGIIDERKEPSPQLLELLFALYSQKF